MKPPRIVPMKMPMPTSKAVKAGRDAAPQGSAFAYHPPAKVAGLPKLRRPKGGHGPHNPEE